MTVEEFSNEFDSLLGSYLSLPNIGETQGTQSIEIDEYEKSVLLTNAQEDLVLSMYNGKNPFNDSFESTEETRSYLRSLIKSYRTSTKETINEKISNDSVFFKIPDDVWFIAYESVNFDDDSIKCKSNSDTVVVPTAHDDFARIKSNPFKMASSKRVLRLDAGNDVVELVSKYNIKDYFLRYLAQPSPIILTDLPEGLAINNITVKTECKLNPVLHRVILENAVKMALNSRAQYLIKNNN